MNEVWQILRKKRLENFGTNDLVKYIDEIFFISEHGEESLKVLIEQVNRFNHTITFTAEYSKEIGNLRQIRSTDML